VLQRGGRFAVHGSEGKRFLARCDDRAISILPGLRGKPKSAEAEGMLLVGIHRDEGENHYYFAQKA